MIKYIIILLSFLGGLGGNNPREIARINRLKKDAELFFKQNNFQEAAKKYIFLSDSMEVDDPEIMLNLAHCYYHMNDTASAKTAYQNVAALGSKPAKSIAYQQLGVMAKKPESLEESLQLMKAAVKEDPSNMDARYDYEVVKKLIEQQKQDQQQQQDQNDNEQNKDDKRQNEEEKNQEQQQNQQQDQEKDKGEQQQEDQQQEQEGEEGEEQEQQQQQEGEESEEQKEQEASTQEKLQEMNISEEMARKILEAMRNNEIQYIQQQKRKATKRPESDKPDW